jgi:hypothetical protein
MGFKGAVREQVERICPKAFTEESPNNLVNARVICDVLTILRNYSPSRNTLWTGIEFFGYIVDMVRKEFDAGTQVFYVCCDVHEMVPPLKGEEQARRDKGVMDTDEDPEDSDDETPEEKKKPRYPSSKRARNDARNEYTPPKIPYPDDAEICDEGIRCRDFVQYKEFFETDDTKMETKEEEEDSKPKEPKFRWRYKAADPSAPITVTKFDMERVLRSRMHVRPRLWSYLITRLIKCKNRAEGEKDPETGEAGSYFNCAPYAKSVIFDTGTGKDGAPVQIIAGYPKRIDLVRHLNPFGESDHKLIYWAWINRKHPVRIDTIDQDMMGLAFVYAAQASPQLKQPFIWRWLNQKKSAKPNSYRYMDVRKAAHAVLWKEMAKVDKKNTEPGMMSHTAMSWLITCFLLGTDYVKKTAVTPTIGEDRVLDFAHKLRSMLDLVKIDMQTLREIDEAEAKEGKTALRREQRNIWPRIPDFKTGKATEMIHDQWRLLVPEKELQKYFTKSKRLERANGFIPDPHLVQFFEELYKLAKPGKAKNVATLVPGMQAIMFQLQYYLIDFNKLPRREDPYVDWAQRKIPQLLALPKAIANNSSSSSNKRKAPEEEKEGNKEDQQQLPPPRKKQRLGERILERDSGGGGEKVAWAGDESELNALMMMTS